MGVLNFSQILKVLQLQDYRYSIETFNFSLIFFNLPNYGNISILLIE